MFQYLTVALRRELVGCQFGILCKLFLGGVGRKIVEQVILCGFFSLAVPARQQQSPNLHIENTVHDAP